MSTVTSPLVCVVAALTPGNAGEIPVTLLTTAPLLAYAGVLMATRSSARTAGNVRFTPISPGRGLLSSR